MVRSVETFYSKYEVQSHRSFLYRSANDLSCIPGVFIVVQSNQNLAYIMSPNLGSIFIVKPLLDALVQRSPCAEVNAPSCPYIYRFIRIFKEILIWSVKVNCMNVCVGWSRMKCFPVQDTRKKLVGQLICSLLNKDIRIKVRRSTVKVGVIVTLIPKWLRQ
jgi:hypothetical protein